MAKRRKRGFGEPPAKHKESFKAYEDLQLLENAVKRARDLIQRGQCMDALGHVTDARASVTAMGVHGLGFRLTKAQTWKLNGLRTTVRELEAHFKRNCVCDKGGGYNP